MIGDLNEIILPSESRGGKFLINRAARFQEVIREWCLLDLGLQGLDRALNDSDWRIQFPEAFVEHLCRLHFDHNPIFLRDRPSGSKLPGLLMKVISRSVVQDAWVRSDIP